jgi:hypothetical protein
MAYADILADIQSSKTAIASESPDISIATNDTTSTPINIGPNTDTLTSSSIAEWGFDSVQAARDHPVQSEADCDDSSSQATSGPESLPGSDGNSDEDEDSDIDCSEEHLVSGCNRNIYSKFNSRDVDCESDLNSEVADQSENEDEDEEEDVLEEGGEYSDDEEAY